MYCNIVIQFTRGSLRERSTRLLYVMQVLIVNLPVSSFFMYIECILDYCMYITDMYMFHVSCTLKCMRHTCNKEFELT